MSAVTVDAAGPDDRAAVAELLFERDGVRRDAETLAAMLCDLDPRCFRAWIARVDGQPAGMTGTYLRRLSWGPRTIAAGYWGHLYVSPEHRRLMLYPRLVMAMQRDARDAGCEILFTATRQSRVAEAHQRLGFHLVGRLPVRFKPLRPFRLLARRRGLGRWASLAAAPADALYRVPLIGGWKRRRGSEAVREIDPAGPDAAAVADLMNRARSGAVARIWSAAAVGRRFLRAPDGSAYSFLGLGPEGAPDAVAICCVAVRDGIRTGVILELAARSDRAGAARALSCAVEGRFLDAGCDVVLYLDDLRSDPAKPTADRGYRTAPYEYHMLVWPAEAVDVDTGRLASWRFTFADHDAF